VESIVIHPQNEVQQKALQIGLKDSKSLKEQEPATD